ncbi:Thioredoxin [hydrothermal vent metagenome]|uniref:Thioredoxin n=1 Tax=hydrothermal vent metagenome TaxID=652676 RepID=A0A3B0ZZD4_9ZZZZ
MATIDLTGDNFEEIISNNDFVIIDFWAPWCGPCQGFASVYTDTSEKYSDIVFAKVNTEDQQELGGHFQIRSIPTLMIFREQVILYSEAGAMQASEFEKLIEQAKAVDMADVHKQMAEQTSKS